MWQPVKQTSRRLKAVRQDEMRKSQGSTHSARIGTSARPSLPNAVLIAGH